MQIEAASITKYRNGIRNGDDVILTVPGRVYAVFDGATDARGTVVDGVPAGRLAALTVAQATAEVMQDSANRRLAAETIFERLSLALHKRTQDGAFAIPPSTTLALALDCGREWRFLILGDSGIRLNGTDVLQPTKLIDKVSTSARVALFQHLRDQFGSDALDEAEMATRRAIFLGLDQSIAENRIPATLAAEIIQRATQACNLADHADIVESFLRSGICKQYLFANSQGTIFSFDTMNGTAPCLGQWIDRTFPKNEIQSIELFTDGYPTPPETVSLSDWQDTFIRMEDHDFHMLGDFSAVKGATSTEHHDDRSVVILKGLNG
ncbi:protein phosphatase 2C domain-containing protein [Yoonia vestfoldensis]|uniref:Protein phosphatase 2C n=1 Tax=Yoonia vestfoldensis TaxID=245188 RepID=A0A1Y0EGA7_9RHOB|nr:protein phosphatase 2C domain-containing protein [Yoonia vestfoldensis]ARU02459.1 protein phosphatase 2C [Yoonia vestfoldensis]